MTTFDQLFADDHTVSRETALHWFNLGVQSTEPEVFTVEHNGDFWQSVFPSRLAHLSQLHTTEADARAYLEEHKP